MYVIKLKLFHNLCKVTVRVVCIKCLVGKQRIEQNVTYKVDHDKVILRPRSLRALRMEAGLQG